MRLLVAILLLLVTESSFAVTRYYLPSSGAAAVNPPINADWSADTRITGAAIAMPTATTNTALTSSTGASDNKELLGQFVSAPIGVFNFNGTAVSLVVSCVRNTSNAPKLRVNIRLYHPDTTFTNILPPNFYDNAYSGGGSTRIIPSGTAVANVTSQNGDRIVVEVGDSISTGGGAQRFGDPTASSDFALTTGLATDLRPWVEFSGTIPASTNPVMTDQWLGFFSWIEWSFARLWKRAI
jgi:hypothetical protein